MWWEVKSLLDFAPISMVNFGIHTVKHFGLMQAVVCGIFPAKDQNNFRQSSIPSGIGRTELKVLVNPCSDVPSKPGPPNSIAIFRQEKLGAALIDQRKQVFVQETVEVMQLAEGTSVTHSP